MRLRDAIEWAENFQLLHRKKPCPRIVALALSLIRQRVDDGPLPELWTRRITEAIEAGYWHCGASVD